MKDIIRNYGWLSLLFLVLSCARMGTPDGGWYDDTPPYVVHSSPQDRGTNVKAKRVAIHFNEYIKIEDVQNKVIVSPPQLEMPDIKATGKRIVISLQDSLKPETTYTIDFSDAISDNNEGNSMGNYTFSFSTGADIDTLQVSGYVLDASNLEPMKGVLVGLYVDSLFADSTFHTLPMVRVSRTNGSGQFTIKGVSAGRYRIRALKDNDGDFVYGQKSETVGFIDDIIEPSAFSDTRKDTLWTDTLHISNVVTTSFTHFMPDDVTLLCFQALQTDRFLVKTERKDPEKIGLFFSYGCDTLPSIHGLNFDADSAFVIEASEKNDTVYYWLRDTALVNQDTLLFEATYLMTDSSGVLVERTDTIEALAKVPYAKRMKEKNKEFEKWKKEQDKKKKHDEPYDSIMPQTPLQVKLNVSGMMDPNQNVCFTMPEPLDVCLKDSIHLYSKIDTLWYRVPFLFEQTSPREYVLKAEWRPGIEYSLEIDSAAFQSIYGLASNPIKQGLKVKSEDEYSTVILNISNQPDSGTVVVQMLDNAEKVMAQSVAEKSSAEFYFVRPGKYYLRAFVDFNGNGQWDTGDYDEGRQAEPVYYFPEDLECKAKWDITRNWNLTARPRYQQKPTAIVKQKPDKEKQKRNRNAERAAEKGIPLPPGK